MDQETQKRIDEQFQTLPDDVQEAIISSGYQTKLQEITKRQKLLIDQAGKLEMETTLVMIGLESLADFIENLQRELGLDVVRAKEVAVDVSETILKPIRDSLRAMNEAAEQADLEASGVDGEVQPAGDEPPAPKFTDSNEQSLNRDQILNEIENPTPIRPVATPIKAVSPEVQTKGGSLNPLLSQGGVASPRAGAVGMELETLDELPYQQDIKPKTEPARVVPRSDFQVVGFTEKKNLDQGDVANQTETANLLETKMADVTITKRLIVDAQPETKIPEAEKKRPSSGVDPYREPII